MCAGLLVTVCAGCGSSSGSATPARTASSGSATQGDATATTGAATQANTTAAPGGHASDPLGELRPAQVPSGWPVAHIPDGATMPYPPDWTVIRGDRGTATAAVLDARGRYLGYLNVTPRQADETLRGWAAFRMHHNAEEGELELRMLGSRTAVRIRGGRGSCVEDAYTTSVGTRYTEIACLIAGPGTSDVFVGAAAPGSLARVAPMLERAISAATA